MTQKGHSKKTVCLQQNDHLNSAHYIYSPQPKKTCFFFTTPSYGSKDPCNDESGEALQRLGRWSEQFMPRNWDPKCAKNVFYLTKLYVAGGLTIMRPIGTISNSIRSGIQTDEFKHGQILWFVNSEFLKSYILWTKFALDDFDSKGYRATWPAKESKMSLVSKGWEAEVVACAMLKLGRHHRHLFPSFFRQLPVFCSPCVLTFNEHVFFDICCFCISLLLFMIFMALCCFVQDSGQNPYLDLSASGSCSSFGAIAAMSTAVGNGMCASPGSGGVI